MWIIYSKADQKIISLSPDSEMDLEKAEVLAETIQGLVNPGKLKDYDAIQVNEKGKAVEYMAAFPGKLVLTGSGAKLKPVIREPECFSLFITMDAPDKHPVDGIPEIKANGKSSTLITIQKVDERNKPQKGANDNDQLYLRADHGIIKDAAGKKTINSITLKKGAAQIRLFSEAVKRVATIQVLSADSQMKGSTLQVEFI
jgi:hypothetical protein